MAFNIKNFLKLVGLLMAFGHFHVAYADDAFVDITIPHNDLNATPVVDVYIGDKGPFISVIKGLLYLQWIQARPLHPLANSWLMKLD